MLDKHTLLVDIQYFPSYTYFNNLGSFSNCVFEQYDVHLKTSFCNRCTIVGSNGPLMLSIPLAGGRNQKRPLKDVRIDYRENWQVKHWKSIQSCYNRSPFLNHFREDLTILYSRKHDFLLDWNLRCIDWVCDRLSISASLSLSEKFVKYYDPDLFADRRRALVNAAPGESDESRYPQVFEDRLGFIPNLSVLDRLFCVGSL